MKDFRKLRVWEKSHQLALNVYKITKDFPNEELYGLTSQMRRASTSIPTNVAEGCGRSGGLDFVRFLYIAMGSASELEYLFLLAKELKYIENSQHTEIDGQVTDIKRMLANLIKKVKAGR